MWHWKAVRTGLTEQFDDQFVDSTIDPVVNKNWGGRKSDHQTGGGYKDNITDDQLAPAMGTKMWNDTDSYAIGLMTKCYFLIPLSRVIVWHRF